MQRQPVSTDLASNIAFLKMQFGKTIDLIQRDFCAGEGLQARTGVIFCLDGLADSAKVESLLRAALELGNAPFHQPPAKTDPVEQFTFAVAQALEVQTSNDLEEGVQAILRGEAVFFLNGSPTMLVVDARNPPARSVEEPSTETETRGPRDGFTESVMTNLALLRRRVRDPRLRAEGLKLGRHSKTDVAVVYLDGIADKDLVAEVKRRLQRIDVDAVVGSGYIEEMIQDNPYSPLGALNYTERPDKLAGNLLEGRVGIIVDNTPFVLVVPTIFWHWLQAPGDYYQSYMVATAYRLLRVMALFTALVTPSLYVMFSSFHHEMIPTPLALSMAAGREGTPLPTLIEVLAMTIMFEIMHEAGLRLPRAVGQTVSIVGALVIGEAAVMAGLVAPATVIVVATAGLSGFAVPFYSGSLAIRLIRIPLLLLSGTLGVFGFVFGTSVLALHAASLRNFGQPFLSPLAPLKTRELKDTLVRAPWWAMTWRPHLAAGKGWSHREQVDAPAPPGGDRQ